MVVDLAGISVGGGLGNKKIVFVKEAYATNGLAIPGVTGDSIMLFEGAVTPTLTDGGLVKIVDAEGTELTANTLVKGIIIL